MYYFDYTYLIFIVPALIISIFAQIKVKSTFKKYSGIRSKRNITGREVADRILSYNGISQVGVTKILGNFNDHYDPRDDIIRLSENVYNNSSISAVGVAAHESGHAIQKHQQYSPMKLRGALVPVVNFSSSLSFPLIFIGFLLPVEFDFIIYLGIILFSACVLFELINLPVEINASKRALVTLEEMNILDEEELSGARKVLSAAAFTYVAATFTSIMNLFRFIFLASGRRKN